MKIILLIILTVLLLTLSYIILVVIPLRNTTKGMSTMKPEQNIFTSDNNPLIFDTQKELKTLTTIGHNDYIVIGNNQVKINLKNGDVTYGDDVDLTESAELFWKAIKSVYQESYKEGYNTTMWRDPNSTFVTCPNCKHKIELRNIK